MKQFPYHNGLLRGFICGPLEEAPGVHDYKDQVAYCNSVTLHHCETQIYPNGIGDHKGNKAIFVFISQKVNSQQAQAHRQPIQSVVLK
jgi:hypothetical protein